MGAVARPAPLQLQCEWEEAATWLRCEAERTTADFRGTVKAGVKLEVLIGKRPGGAQPWQIGRGGAK
jgi:hypothetical protein